MEDRFQLKCGIDYVWCDVPPTPQHIAHTIEPIILSRLPQTQNCPNDQLGIDE